MNEFEILRSYVKPINTAEVLMGPGDDCSVLNFDSQYYMISSSDCLVEGVHFRLSDLTAQDLAYKCLAVNISDIAAMGGEAKWVHLSLAIPPYFSELKVKDFFSSFNHTCEEQKILLLGGDISSSPQGLFININISGLVEKKCIQLRKSFNEAEILCVTGSLGDSSAGLYCFLNNINSEEQIKLKEIHKHPPIEIKKTQWLSQQDGVKGMIDLSDGLMSDLQRIPNLGFQVSMEQIPHSQDLLSFCESKNLNPFQFSLAGGEDYRILFGCKEKCFDKIKQDYYKIFNENFYEIGRVIKDSQEIHYYHNGKVQNLSFKTFSHF